jgi:hypothetical protein
MFSFLCEKIPDVIRYIDFSNFLVSLVILAVAHELALVSGPVCICDAHGI